MEQQTQKKVTSKRVEIDTVKKDILEKVKEVHMEAQESKDVLEEVKRILGRE